MQFGITQAECNHSIHELHVNAQILVRVWIQLAKSGMAKAIQAVSFVPPLYVVIICILYFTRFYHFLLFFSNLLPSFSFYPLLPSYDYFLCQYSFFTTPFLTFPPFHLRAQLLNKYSWSWWHICGFRNMGHSRTRKVCLYGTTILPPGSGCNCCLWHHR